MNLVCYRCFEGIPYCKQCGSYFVAHLNSLYFTFDRVGETKKYKEIVDTYKPLQSMRWPHIHIKQVQENIRHSFLFIHLFIPYLFTEHQLCARHCFLYWRYSIEEESKSFCFLWTYCLVILIMIKHSIKYKEIPSREYSLARKCVYWSHERLVEFTTFQEGLLHGKGDLNLTLRKGRYLQRES